MWEISWVVSHVDSLLFRTVLCERRIRTWHVSAVLFPSSGSLVKTCLQGIENLTLTPLLLSPFGQPLAGKTRVFMEFSQVLPHTRLAIAPMLLAQWSPCLSPVLIPGEAEKIEDVRIWGNGGSSWCVSHLWDGSHLGRRASDPCWRVHEDEQIWCVRELNITQCTRNGWKGAGSAQQVTKRVKSAYGRILSSTVVFFQILLDVICLIMWSCFFNLSLKCQKSHNFVFSELYI